MLLCKSDKEKKIAFDCNRGGNHWYPCRHVPIASNKNNSMYMCTYYYGSQNIKTES